MFFVGCLLSNQLISQNKYEINLEVKGIAESRCYLSYYSGTLKNNIDTAGINDKGDFCFKKNISLSGGIYQIQFTDNSFFEFISDGYQETYNMSTNASDLQSNLKISKSEENKLFINYLQTISKYKQRYPDTYKDKISEYVNEVISKSNTSFFAQYLKILYNSNEKPTYWGNFNFAEKRLIRTKVFLEKINYYLDKLTPQTSNELIKETSLIVEKSKADIDIYQYVISNLCGKYKDSENIDYKEVYIHIAKTYCLPKKAIWLSNYELSIIEGLVDKNQFEVAKSKNEIYGYTNYLNDFPKGKYITEVKDSLDILNFNVARSTNTVSAYLKYLVAYPIGKFVDNAKVAIEQVKYDEAKKGNSLLQFEKYISEYPGGKYLADAKINIEKLKFEEAIKTNTIVSFNKYLTDFPDGKYKTEANSRIIGIQNKAKEAELKLIAEKKQKEWEAKMKLEETLRIQELENAASDGVDALVQFADKWPNTNESKQALRILSKYGAENNTLEKKVYVEDAFYWVADGDRSWLNELYESNRDWMSGGAQYNLFVFAKIHNRSKEILKIQALVNLNLLTTSHLSIFSSSGKNILTAGYLMELQPGESKGLIVMFQNISAGSSYGSGLLSAGSSQSLSTSNPFDVYFKYYTGTFPQSTIKFQQDLVRTIIKNEGNIKISRSGKDVFTEKVDSWFGLNTDDYAELYVYFNKKTYGDETLTIRNSESNVIKEDIYSSSGYKNESYILLKDQSYKVYVPGYGEYNVYVKKRLTHLIVDGNGTSKVTYDN